MTSRRTLCARLAAATLVGAGAVMGAAGSWQVWSTDLAAEQAQEAASGVLDQQWRDAIPTPAGHVATGTPLARITIPRFGNDWTRVLLEGVDQDTLAKGPGHYPGAGQLGQAGNYAIAGHRVGQGAPFDGAGELTPCDPITVDTETETYTYRVLPYGGLPTPCRLPAVHATGQEIVTPDDVSVISDRPDPLQTNAALLTITTCHPRFSARQRLIVHAVLVASAPAHHAATRI